MIKVNFELYGDWPKVNFERLVGDEIDFVNISPALLTLPNDGGSVTMSVFSNSEWIIN